MADNLKQKAASGVAWTSIQKFAGMGISFISGIILARLLTPYDYGCIGMLSIFMVLANTFIDGGFGSALIQKKQPSQTDYTTIFYWNIGMSTLMYVILFFSAPAIARFYKIPILSSVLRVQGIVLFINAFNLVQNNQLRKKLQFKAISIVTLTTSIISLTVTIWMAYNGYGVWSLVAANILSSAIPTVVFWFYLKWRPTFEFSKQSFKELFSFGIYMFLSNFVNELGAKISELCIGKVYNPATLGYYTKAVSTENLASSSISQVMTQVTYPLYAEAQDDKAMLGNMIKRLTTTIAYITFPIMFILILTAKPVFLLLYSDRWLESVPYFRVLCICGIAICLQSVNTQSIAAIGKSKIMFRWTLIKRTLGSTLVVGGLFLWGMKGLLLGCVLYTWFCYFVNIGLVSKHIGYHWTKQLLHLMPMGLTCVIVSVVCYFGVGFLHLGNIYMDGLAKGVLFVLLYMGWSLIFKPESYTYTLSIIPSKFRFWEKYKKNSHE